MNQNTFNIPGFPSLPDKAGLSPQEEQRIEREYRSIVDSYLGSHHRRKVELIERAFRLAENVHRGRRRRNGEPFIIHPLAVAKTMTIELGLGSTSICSALLHEVLRESDYTRHDLAKMFGDKIADIVEGVDKISGGIFGDRASVEAGNFKRLLLSMSTDIRVVLVKMADRLHNMRTLDALSPEKRDKIARETLYVYAPLSERLGLFTLKREFEDLAFRHEHPQEYAEIMRQVEQSQEEREKITTEFMRPVRMRLDALRLKYDIKARVKSAYSIFKKMQKKGIPFDQIYDVYAVRIIFENEPGRDEADTCHLIHEAISSLYPTHPDRLRDWTRTPKANGYRALHLTAMADNGRWIEVQVRSRKWDDIAELGYAAHWKYKEEGENGKEEPQEINSLMNLIKEILENPSSDAMDFLDTIRLNLFAPEIYVLTPKGDVVTLPSGATVLDMAFSIHSELGMHCIAGKIGHRLVAPSHPLESGDTVEIVSSAKQMPQKEWLGCCRTARARSALQKVLAK